MLHKTTVESITHYLWVISQWVHKIEGLHGPWAMPKCRRCHAGLRRRTKANTSAAKRSGSDVSEGLEPLSRSALVPYDLAQTGGDQSRWNRIVSSSPEDVARIDPSSKYTLLASWQQTCDDPLHDTFDEQICKEHHEKQARSAA
jgi:hypothetical protein